MNQLLRTLLAVGASFGVGVSMGTGPLWLRIFLCFAMELFVLVVWLEYLSAIKLYRSHVSRLRARIDHANLARELDRRLRASALISADESTTPMVFARNG